MGVYGGTVNNSDLLLSLGNCLLRFAHNSWRRSGNDKWQEDAGVTRQTDRACQTSCVAWQLRSA